MKTTIIIICIFFGAMQVDAQNLFVSKGKVEYEKKVNIHKVVDSWSDGDEDSWILNLKKEMPQFEITYFDLFFDGDKTLYKPGREVTLDKKIPDWFRGPATDNIVYSNLSSSLATSQKTVFEKTFLVEDSLRRIDWRIMPDLRMIAGFECHKAVGIIMDSVYIIAFYTDQILTSGGPEGFNGLPGMILGVAIPRINVTFFATKLELVPVKPETFMPPKKGSKVNNADLMKQLQESLKDWKRTGQRNIWNIML